MCLGLIVTKQNCTILVTIVYLSSTCLLTNQTDPQKTIYILLVSPLNRKLAMLDKVANSLRDSANIARTPHPPKGGLEFPKID